jgi:NAD(P)H-hydrate epimerase
LFANNPRGAASRVDDSLGLLASNDPHNQLMRIIYSLALPFAALTLSSMTKLHYNTPELWRASLPVLEEDAHKYTRGYAVVSGGPLACTGAARLAAMAASRAGAGVVSVACAPDALPVYAASLLSIMTKPVRHVREFTQLIEDGRVSALVVGPGGGVSEETRERLVAALATKKPLVIDADALSVLGAYHKSIAPMLHPACVLTPHEAEFARISDVTGSRQERAQKAAKALGAVLVLKGPETLIAAPDGTLVMNLDAPATLATAGSGDVLSGIIAGLLAQGMPVFEAACAGVWMHSAAARMLGRGMIAEDIIAQLPQVWDAL